MIKQYFKQSLVLLQQNKLLSVIAILVRHWPLHDNVHCTYLSGKNSQL